MGYFPNGSAGADYEETVCSKCVHYVDIDVGTPDCPIIEAHFEFNYKHCNWKGSMLHWFIPRDKKGNNQQCRFFQDREKMAERLNQAPADAPLHQRTEKWPYKGSDPRITNQRQG